MDLLDTILIKSYIFEIVESMKMELERIKKDRPNAIKYINGMSKHIEQMNKTQTWVYLADKENRELISRYFEIQRENLELKKKIQNLEKKNKRLFDGI